MARVTVLILHPEPAPDAGPLTKLVTEARRLIAEHHRVGFTAAGADEVLIVGEPADDTPFGARLRSAAAIPIARNEGVVVLGSGAVPLITMPERRALVTTAAAGEARAMANNRYSADVVAIGRANVLSDVPDLPSDNALPRWLGEHRSYEIADRRMAWRLGLDLDGPLDLLLLAAAGGRGGRLLAGLARSPVLDPARRAIAAVSSATRDRRAEVLVAGRTSIASLAELERSAVCQIRALVEERGLRASSPLAQMDQMDQAEQTGQPRPPSSTLGRLLELEPTGPASLGTVVGRLADAAVIDSRVLLAHRCGPDPGTWPAAEDRYASDLLVPELVTDTWLRDLTESARSSAAPIVLGGHSLVGPGLRLLPSSAWGEAL